MNRIIQRLLIFSVISIFLTGCVHQSTVLKAPDDFVQQIDSTEVMDTLNALDEADAMAVRFQSGQAVLSAKALKHIDDYIDVYAPELVAVMGTAGHEKYRKLGEARTQALLKAFHERGVDSVMLNYRPKSKGLRGVIWTLDAELSARIRQQAPAWVVYGRTPTDTAVPST